MGKCWCGTTDLLFFSAEYSKCSACGTLVSLVGMSVEQLRVADDETDFYGKQYWLSHQSTHFDYPDIYKRAQNDLTERNLHWLQSLLKFCLPPAKVLELGCSHGSFVALLRHAGYDSAGVEMSPWVVEFGQQTFGVPISVGPIESLDIAPGSLDVIALMDVLEHLPDPVATMAHCLQLLKPEGLLLVQTPKFEEEMDYNALVETTAPFLMQLKAEEHLYLFSDHAVERFFRQLGAAHIRFEPAIFDHYDMFFAVSRVPLQTIPPEQMQSVLTSMPTARLVLAMLELRTRELDLIRRLQESTSDGTARLSQIESLTAMLKKAANGRSTRKMFSWAHAGLSLFLRSISRVRPDVNILHGQVNPENGMVTKNPPRMIAVDLTPVLPGGENGGAKIFVLELLRHLAAMAPNTQFVLFTQSAAHDELAVMDRQNMRRHLVIGGAEKSTIQTRAQSLANRVLPHLPRRLRLIAGRLGSKLRTITKRYSSGSLLRDMHADLLFCPFTAPTYFESGIPTVCTIYDLQYKTYPEFFSAEDVAHRDHTFIEACRRATVLTAISNYSRHSAIDHGSLDPACIRTIHLRLAHRIRHAEIDDKVLLTRLGLTAQRYLVYPANFWKHKNHEMLFTAFGMAFRDGLSRDIKLVCTGQPGARQDWLIAAARSMNLEDRVLFPGYLLNTELATLIAHCSGVVFPSLYEGFGLPVIEAMAAGVPVACSNTTSLPEVVADAAILFDPRVPTQIAQSIISLVENNALRAQLVEAGRMRAAEFADSERMAREYWALFLYALAKRADK